MHLISKWLEEKKKKKRLRGFRSLSRYSVFDLSNFAPVKIQRRRRFRNVNAVYHSHRNADISRFRTPRSLQNPVHTAKQMIPRDILGDIGFPREMKLFVTNMSIFHSLFARGREWQVLTSLSLSRHVFC